MSPFVIRDALKQRAPWSEGHGQQRRISAPAYPDDGNAGLLLDRYLQQRGDDNTALRELHAWVANEVPTSLYVTAFDQWRSSLASLTGPSSAVAWVEVTTRRDSERGAVHGRLSVGLGAESVRETSIALHRTWGIPIIPGSALKGLARRYLERHLPDDAQKVKYRDVLFGSTAGAGYVTFFDAWYVPGSAPNDRPLALDTITVHHPRYYNAAPGARREPWDFDDPTPVSFLSACGSFLVAVRGPDERWAGAALDMLTTALTDWGVGAKTSSGYGRLQEALNTRWPRPALTVAPFATSAQTEQARGSAEPSSFADVPSHTATSSSSRNSSPDTTNDPLTISEETTEGSVASMGTTTGAPLSLTERIDAIPGDFRLNERLAALVEEIERLPAGQERDAASRAVVRRLQTAGTWNNPRTQRRTWIQAIIRYLNARRSG